MLSDSIYWGRIQGRDLRGGEVEMLHRRRDARAGEEEIPWLDEVGGHGEERTQAETPALQD